MNGVHLGLMVLAWFGISEVYQFWTRPRMYIIQNLYFEPEEVVLEKYR